MDVALPEFRPDPTLNAAAMKAQQRDIAAQAVFSDAMEVTPSDLRVSAMVESQSDPVQAAGDGGPVVVGIDQAFRDDKAVSAVVAIQDDAIVEQVVGTAPVEIPYIPGLLAYREAGAIIDGLTNLGVEPDIVLCDGSGRIHYRQAGIATHIGTLFDVPAIGVAKSLLCGTPQRSLSTPLPAKDVVPIEADAEVEPVSTDDADWPVIGAAYQSRQFPKSDDRHVNPVYVSPGHRCSMETAVSIVAATCDGYKLPIPIRVADALAADVVPGD